MRKRIHIGILATAMTLAGVAQAGDGKSYVGAMCNFEYFPLQPHSRSEHRFINLSPAKEWVSCPIVRDVFSGNIEYVRVRTSVNGIQYPRLEQVTDGSTQVTGWGVESNTSNSQIRTLIWFDNDPDGAPSSTSSLSLEFLLDTDAYIKYYRVTEG